MDSCEQRIKDALFEILMHDTEDVIFQYNVKEDKYVANHSVLCRSKEEAKPVEISNLALESKKYPGLQEIYAHLSNLSDGVNEFEIDMSTERNGRVIPLWYHVACTVIKDEGEIICVTGKMHNITRIKLSREKMRNKKKSIGGQKGRNSVFDKIMKDADKFTEREFTELADGHRFMAQMMEDVNYAKSLTDGLYIMLELIANHFQMDRIYVVEVDIYSGTCSINYQWNRQRDTKLEHHLEYMKIEEVRSTVADYDRCGYIEVNPSKGILSSKNDSVCFLQRAIYDVLLGNQIWLPMLARGRYIGAVCFDRYDTTPYTVPTKFLLSELVNSLTAQLLKINAENSNRAKSDFLSTMSHEIRTPMNAIVGMTEVALRQEISDDVKKNLKMVKSSALGLLTLINDILDFSKIEAGKFDIVPETFSLLSLLYDVRGIANAKNKGKINLEFLVPEDIPARFYGDSVRIKQVMINYITNAIKYSDKGTVQVIISFEKKLEDRGVLTFAVKDEGIGIRKEDLRKLFKSYVRVDTTVNHHKEGTGLGLAISKQLIELMDGTVSVVSEYGKGSTFSFALPIQILDATPAGSFESYNYEDDLHEEEECKPVITRDARVLVVDDAPINLLVAESLLEPTGVKVDTAESGEMALELIQEQDYDLVFMDYFMPEMDGSETTKCIRNLSGNKKEVPVIALTADATENVREELLRIGMSDFMTKPIILKDLYDILRKWLKPEKIV